MRPALASALAAPLWILACGRAAEPPPPRAIVIVVDTLRRDALGCYGAAGAPTPAIDGLAAEGTRFERCIASSGWTLPSVASLLTGTWPSVHKALGKKTRLSPISADVSTLAELLGDAGVFTAAVANAAFLSPALELDRGFDVFDHRHAFNRRIRRAQESVDAALSIAAEHREEPLFLLVHLFDPHLDYDPPDKFARELPPHELEPPASMQDVLALCGPGGRRMPKPGDAQRVRELYQAEVRGVDDAVARLLEGLDELGIAREAWIILTSDHGEEFWEHRGFEHGHQLYDELVRVPLVVRPPRGTARVPVAPNQVRNLDLMPTLLEIFGVPAPEAIAGRTLAGVLAGEDRADRVAYSEGVLYGDELRVLRDGRMTYLVGADEAREELYDHRTDPAETRDLAGSRPDLLEPARRRYRAFRAELDSAAGRTAAGTPVSVSPETESVYERSLESLGYSGRGDE